MTLPLRPNVCMLVFNSGGKLFLGERHGEPGIWQFPQGGVELGLTLQENVIKELHEEMGVRPELLKIERQLEAVNEYDFAEVPAYARGRWRGQSQTFWLVKFTGEDRDINLNLYSPEFMNFRWCTPGEVTALAEPKRAGGYIKPLEEFRDYLKTM